MACWLTAPSHYLNQCQIFISEVASHSPESNIASFAQAALLYNDFEIMLLISLPCLLGAKDLTDPRWAHHSGH